MEHYITTTKFIFLDKAWQKDKVITASDVGEDNIAVLLKKKYIKSTVETSTDSQVGFNNDGNGEGNKDYLSLDELRKLKKTQLVKYAEEIGAVGFERNISVPDLADFINNFIEKELENDNGNGEDDGFLMPDEVAKLTRQELTAYAKEIGMNFAEDIADTDLVNFVNEFIAKELQDGEA